MKYEFSIPNNKLKVSQIADFLKNHPKYEMMKNI